MGQEVAVITPLTPATWLHCSLGIVAVTLRRRFISFRVRHLSTCSRNYFFLSYQIFCVFNRNMFPWKAAGAFGTYANGVDSSLHQRTLSLLSRPDCHDDDCDIHSSTCQYYVRWKVDCMCHDVEVQNLRLGVWGGGSRMNRLCGWEESDWQHHHFNSKRLPLLTLFIKCPITEHVLPWWIINYRSTSWAIYFWLQPANTLNCCSLALNQSSCSKRDLHVRHRCLALEKNGAINFIKPLCGAILEASVCRTSSAEHNEAVRGGRTTVPAMLAKISLIPISTYWGSCHHIGKSAT